MESLTKTLNSLTETKNEEEKLKNKEWNSCLFQILITLITYQKVFKFTHNDLHTNNVMYINTEKKHLYYKFNNKHYKVPTYGRIYKIIDFGRSIYKYKKKIFCSDCFHPKAEAGNQYNCEPYYNPKKRIVNPNYSFDLCRLGCALFDTFIEKVENMDNTKNPIAKQVIEWCKDDKNELVIYKPNGEERYKDFKLYKMITRTVHNHIPCKVIENPLFAKYIISRKKINKKNKIINIDNIPCYY